MEDLVKLLKEQWFKQNGAEDYDQLLMVDNYWLKFDGYGAQCFAELLY